MNKLISFILIFTPFVSTFEWKVARFFKSVKSTDSIFSIRLRLLKLMKENLVVLNLWMEKEYKGYKNLKKSSRKKFYKNSEEIVKLFFDEYLKLPKLKNPYFNDEKLDFIYSIMRFLKPNKYYKYIKSASFFKLLKDPNKETLEGDCNQIVTLYIFLFSRKYNIEDLEIKLLPDHVCLHYKGIDIEATNGQFCKYDKYDHILPITEILSTNLLDITDFREKTRKINARVFLKSAQLSFAISSLREIVEKNLEYAYHNLAISTMKEKNFKSALFYSSKLKDKSLYSNIKRNYAINLYERKSYEKALKISKEIRDLELERACLGAMFNELRKKVENVKTISDVKLNRKTYNKMYDLALKMGDRTLADQIKKSYFI